MAACFQSVTVDHREASALVFAADFLERRAVDSFIRPVGDEHLSTVRSELALGGIDQWLCAGAGDISDSGWTTYGRPIFTTSGKYAGAFEFDGVDDYVKISTSSSLKPSYITVSAWIKTFDNSIAWQQIFQNGKNWNSGQGALLRLNGGGEAQFTAFTSTANTRKMAIITSVINNNVWYHLVGTWNGYDAKIYVDGELKATNTWDTGGSGVLDNDELDATIGRQTDAASAHFNGTIDEVRVWNRSLSAEEIYQQYVSNLNKYDTDKWLLYVNQSKNATASLSAGTYTYQTFASDSFENWNSTEERTITIVSVTLNLPVDTFNTTLTSVTFNCTASDEFNITNVTLYGDWNGSWHANDTNSSGINGANYIFINNITPDGT